MTTEPDTSQHPLEAPTFDEAPLFDLVAKNLETLSPEELRRNLQLIREMRQVPQKRKAATSGKKAKLQDSIAHLLD